MLAIFSGSAVWAGAEARLGQQSLASSRQGISGHGLALQGGFGATRPEGYRTGRANSQAGLGNPSILLFEPKGHIEDGNCYTLWAHHPAVNGSLTGMNQRQRETQQQCMLLNQG